MSSNLNPNVHFYHDKYEQNITKLMFKFLNKLDMKKTDFCHMLMLDKKLYPSFIMCIQEDIEKRSYK
jgi:hypothetical protein